MDSAQDRIVLDPNKFRDPLVTARGESRASVNLKRLETLWFNTGSLCNITCHNCFMESSPTNDRLAYLKLSDFTPFLDEIAANNLPTQEIGFTGGEPFMNPDIIAMLGEALGRGFKVLVLSNAMKPLANKKEALLGLKTVYGKALTIRVSMDHHSQSGHEQVRGQKTWEPMMEGLTWLYREGFYVTVAGRQLWNETQDTARAGYATAFADKGLGTDLAEPDRLVLFPEMDAHRDVPEITEACWDILDVNPESMMCATSRMVIKRKDSDKATVSPCTLLPYDKAFDMGESLSEGQGLVTLNHPYCAQFCVLGGASCSG